MSPYFYGRNSTNMNLNFEPMPAWNPMIGLRMAPAWQAMVEALLSNGQMDHNDLAKVGLAASDLQAKSVDKLILEGRHHGYFAMASGAKALETRRYRLTTRFHAHLTGEGQDTAAA